MKSGKNLIRVGLVMFVIAAVFFKLVIGVSGFGLRRVEGQDNVWETADYDTATDRLDLTIHIAVGSVTIDSVTQ